MSEAERVRLTIAGRVQGVGFRYSAYAVAHRLGLRGWVRNTFDGSVETTVEGTPEAVQEYIAWCRQGPRMAQVTDVDVAPAAGGDLPSGFTIRD